MQIHRHIAILSLLLSLAVGCSMVRPEPAPELRMATVRFASVYLEHIVHDNPTALKELVLWQAYLQSKGGTFTPELFFRKVQAVQKKYTQGNHPLLGLSIRDVEDNGKKVKVYLYKPSAPHNPDIEVDLQWLQTNWSIVGDNLFGGGGILEPIP